MSLVFTVVGGVSDLVGGEDQTERRKVMDWTLRNENF